MKYVILGPTASGKTSYAIAFAKKINGAVISADSRQVYAGMNIGTGKPQEAWKDVPHAIEVPDIIEGIPHYLLNVATLETPYTLSDWLVAAHKVLSIIQQQGKTPLIVGGTMLYSEALSEGYDIPSTTPNKELRDRLEQESAETLYQRLQEQDPKATQFIEPHNKRRIIRALEVMEATGKPFSSLRTASSSSDPYTKIGIFSEWDTLREHVTIRLEQMIKDGLSEEKQRLSSLFPNSPLLQTMNYTEDTVEQMIQSNMRYAHRQMSWWKRKKDISWICL